MAPAVIVQPANSLRWALMVSARSGGNAGMVNGLDMRFLPIAGLAPAASRGQGRIRVLG
jgi:hypothetical protein